MKVIAVAISAFCFGLYCESWLVALGVYWGLAAIAMAITEPKNPTP